MISDEKMKVRNKGLLVTLPKKTGHGRFEYFGIGAFHKNKENRHENETWRTEANSGH